MSIFDTREAYLNEAAALILDELIMPAVEKSTVYQFTRPPFRVSVGFPKHSRGGKGKAVAQCFTRAVSTDGVNEIFVTPECDDAVRVLADLAHELCHATDDCASGHRNFFAYVARAIGLEGKLTHTVAGDDLASKLCDYVELLGPYPHHRMDVDAAHKPSSTRMLKVECTECGFHFRTSKTMITRIRGIISGTARCPACDYHAMKAV